MNASPRRLAALAVLLSASTTLPVYATSFASSASEGASTSVGSSSDSIKQSSNSSSRTTNVAEGDYRVIEVAAAPEQPGSLQLTLQPVADAAAAADRNEGGAFVLVLPRQTVEANHLAAGRVVSARQRPYGIEFGLAPAEGGTQAREPFFLVLHDEWYRELGSHAVAL